MSFRAERGICFSSRRVVNKSRFLSPADNAGLRNDISAGFFNKLLSVQESLPVNFQLAYCGVERSDFQVLAAPIRQDGTLPCRRVPSFAV